MSNSQSATTVNITTHAGATGDLGATSVTKIRPYNWDYTGEYMQSLISSVDLKPGTTLTTSTTNANVTLKFTDGSSIVAPQASVTVLGGQAQTGMTVGTGADISFAYPNATSGITSASQSQISQWAPTYEWVYDANGTALDASHQYNTTYSDSHKSFTAYVKITYHKSATDSTADGTQIVPVTVNINNQTLAQQYGDEIFSHIDHITSHPISAGTTSSADSSSSSADVDANGNPNLNVYTWGIDPAQIIWKNDVTSEQKAEYLSKISSFICTNAHSFPEPGNHGSFNNSTGSGYMVGPGVTIFFTDGSYTAGGQGVTAYIYKPVQVSIPASEDTFNTGDLSKFNEASAKKHVKNVIPYSQENSSFDASYQWVVKDPNATYTFENALDMRNTNQWVTFTNNKWGVANPSNSQGTKGVTITGYRALTKDDIKDAGIKHFYVLIGYTKNANSGSEPGTYDGYYVVPQDVNVTLKGEVDVAKISGNGSQTEFYKGSAYNASNLDLTKFVPTITDENNGNKITNLTPPANNDELQLKDSDYEIHGDPTNVGSYDVYLKASGIDKIKQWTNSEFYDWTGNDTNVKVGTFKINSVSATATITGSTGKTYDNKTVTSTDLNAVASITVPGLTDPIKYTLVDGDYTWNETPTNVGTYTITLTTDGINHLQKAINDKIGVGNVTIADTGVTNKVSYKITQATATVGFTNNEQDVKYDGKADQFDPTKYFKPSVTVTTGSPTIDVSGVQLSVADGDFTFTKDGHSQTTEPTDLGTYTVTLSGKGLTKLQKNQDTTNYNWVNSATGTYKIDQATGIKVTLNNDANGGQSVTYKGEAYGNSDIVPGDYSITLANGKTYTLVTGDLEFGAGQDPTNVGGYQVQLSDQGKRNIEKVDSTHYTYDFSNAGTGTFTITKATPTAKVTGTDSKTYDGSAIANYQPTVSITAPGTNTVSLVAGTDYIWKNTVTNVTSSSAPSDAGNYVIELLPAGETKIKGVNAQNLDWSNVTIGNDTSYVINKRDITVTENGSQEATYDGTSYGDDSGLDASKFVPTLTTTDNVAVPSISGISWDAATDFVVKDAHGNTLTADQIKNAGSYSVYLTDAGLNKLKGVSGAANFNWPASVTSAGTFKIKSAEASATISSSTGRTYDGKATTSSNLNAVVSITVPGETSPISYTLVDGDYTWNTTDHAAPINASDTVYAITLTNAGIQNLQKTINDKIGAGNVTIASADVTNNASYKINKATATVNFANGSGQTVPYTGQIGKFDASKFTPTISTNNDQTLSIPSGVSLSLAAGDFTINGVETTTEPKTLGTYTIGLSDTGFAKLQSATNNYNWVNNAKASYIIKANDEETVTVINKADGGQKVVYKDADYGTSDIDLNDYQLTLPTGLSYTLQAGDLEIVPNTDGNTTTVGSYTVQLSAQGKHNLTTAGGNNFKFDFTKPGVANTSATFEITKATPTVVFNGVGSKTYGQNDTNWTTPTGLTITAPSNPTIALTAEDYEFVGSDGTVYTSIPTNVGTYTVRLSDKGKSLITGSTVNSANLDWANANISGEGTFTVKAAEAKAELSGTNSRDYNGSAVTTTDINNGGTITVKISIPNSTKTINYKLQDGDYTWKDNANTTNVGTYTIELNKTNILAHLQDKIANDSDWTGNVTLANTALSGTATFTVNAKAANVSLSGKNGNGVTYNGSVVSTPLDALKNALSASGTINNAKLDLTGLTTAGFDWYNAAGTTKLASAPTDHGTYTIKLNETGLQQIQDKNSNYTVSIASPNAYTFKINTAKGSVAFDGSRTVTFGTDDSASYFNGYTATLTTNPSTITGFTPSFTLQAGDLQFSSDGRTWTTTVPTAVGTYQVKLSDAARNRIVQDNSANGNIDWPATGFTGVKTYTVTPAQATASLSGSATRPYNGSTVTTTDINNADSTIGVTINLPNNKTTTYKLVDGDYTWVAGSAPTNVGTYQLKFNLTEQGKTNLQNWLNKTDVAGTGLNGKPNVSVPTEVTGTASFEITPVAITVTQSRSDQKTYNGQPASANTSDVIAGITASGTVAGHPLNVPTTGENALTAADFDWWNGTTDLGKVSENSTAPTNAGSYSIKLNADGLQKLQNANKNYSFSSVGDQYGYTINKATATVSITGTQDSPWTGSAIAIDPTKFPATITTNNGLTVNIPAGVTLTAGDYEYVDANGNAIAAPSELGQYKVRLTENGWKKLQSQTDNYTWSYNNSEGTVNINKATATVTLNGSGTVTYTGSDAQIPYDGSYTVTLSNGKTYTLQAGDLEFVNTSAGANTNVGTYHVKLSNEILTHLGADSSVDPTHYTYELAENNTADLIVTPAEATATIGGNTGEAYKGSAYDVTDGTYNGNYTITLSNGKTYTLQNGDYNYIDANGNVLHQSNWPVNVGTYKIGLTDQGKLAIENLTKVTGTDVNNYNWKFVNNATFTITAQKIALVVEGSASMDYDGSAAVITQDDLNSGKVTVRWGNSANAPDGVSYTFTPDDFEVITAGGQPAINANDRNGNKYYIRLKDSVLNNIKATNYEFSIADTNAFYTIHTLSAALVVKGSQTVNYGSPEALNLTGQNHFWIDFENWVSSGKPEIVLQDGDLEIDLDGKPAYDGTNAGLPINVGTYTVKMTDQLINRLKADYGDNYDFDAEPAQSDGAVEVEGVEKKNTNDDVLTKGQDATHNDGVYIVQPLQIKVTIGGSQTVKYGSANYNDPSIINNGNQYSLTFDNIASRDQSKFNNFRLGAGDLEFVSTPGNVGQYQVKLSAKGIADLKAIDPDFATNYDWSVNIENARADFNVVQMPVTITIGNAQGTRGQSVVYGQPTTINNGNYSISVKTEDGKTLDYALQAGDLQFVTDPTNVGKYQVELSAAGLQRIKDKFGTTNYTYSSTGNGDFEVTPAEATITLSGDDSSTYNSSTPNLDVSKYHLAGLPSGVNFTLQDGDLTFVDADGNALADQPVNASDTPYRVGLTKAAKDRLEALDGNQGKNYTWNFDQTGATYKINQATATISFKNDQDSQTVDYNGQTGQFDPSKFAPTISTGNGIPTPSIPTDLNLSVADGDFEFVPSGQTSGSTTEPTAEGTYTVKLTDKGMQKIYGTNTTNYSWTNSTVGTYTINSISISVSGQGNQNATYDGTTFGNANGLDLSKFVPTLNAGTVGVPTIPAGTLTADDYTIKNGKGETVTNPTNAGTYTVWLNENGLSKLKKLSNNFTWPTAPIQVGTLNIAQADVTGTLSGSNSKTYDGKLVSTTDINKVGGNIAIQVTVNGKTYNYALQDGDYTWSLTGGAPTNAGEYTGKIVLDTTGTLAQHLTQFINKQNKDLEGNFKIDAKNLTGSASFNITPKAATVTQGGSGSKPYDGTAGSVTLDQLLNNMISNDLVSGQNLNTSGLTLNDFAWSGADTNHIAAGDYSIALTPAGLAKLQADNPNYKLSVTGSFKYTINQATASAELSGSGEKTYNGEPVSNADIQKSDQNNNITVKVTIPGESTPQTVTFGVNDFTWSTPDGKSPTAAGTYTITLNDAGKAAIKKQFADNKNIDWAKTTFTGSATYKINKADGQISFIGSDSKNFDNKEVLPSDLDGSKFYVTVNGQQIALPQNGYEFVDKDGNKVTPKNAGTYYVVLTPDGLAALEKDTNYSWTPNWNGTTRPNQIGTFVINQTKVTPAIVGPNNKTYNGAATTLAEVTKDGKIKVTVDSGNTEFTIPNYVLTDGDYDWFGTDGSKISAPTDAGHYIIKLNSKGLQNIQAYLDKTYGQGNVALDPTKDGGQAEFDINPFEITVTIKGSETVDSGVTSISDGHYSFDFSPTTKNDQLPAGWTAPTIPVSDLDFDGASPTATTENGTFTVNYKGGQDALQKLLGGNYKVNYEAGKNYYIVAAQDQSVKIIFVDDDNHGSQVGPDITKDGKTGQQIDLGLTIPTNYVLANGQTLPTTYKFTSAKDQTITIHLVHELVPTSDTKTITETIHYRYADGSQAASDKVAKVTYTRSGLRDAVTGIISWDPWTPAGSQSFAAVDSPEISGYTPDQQTIPEQTVTVDSNNLEFTVTYNLNSQPDNPDNPDQPVNPDNPDQPVNPDNPSQPVNPDNPNTPDQPNNPDQPVTPGKPVGPTFPGQPGKPGTPVQPGNGLGQENLTGTTNQQAKRLPQTGDGHNEAITTAGLLLASLSGLFGLGGLKKKRDER